MGSAELSGYDLVIHSHIITYGNAATPELTELIRAEIETMWNEPSARVKLRGTERIVRFRTTAETKPQIEAAEILSNTDPRNNYFRIEEYAYGNISFVDGLGCNTGYFKVENLYAGSTTAAHEYGHTLGLDHPRDLDLRGRGVPGIMYPRGTLVDPPFQYNPSAVAGDSSNGGTMHPKFRKVLEGDIAGLKLHKLVFNNQSAIVGDFSGVWHPDHATLRFR